MSAPANARQRHLLPLPNILAGAIAACTAVLVTNMPETVKTRLQLDGEGAARGAARQYTGIADATRQILRKEGIRGLQAGLQAAIAYQAVMNGCRLGMYDPLQRSLRSATGASEQSPLVKIAAGATSGAIGATLGSPLYLVKSRLQAESKHFHARETHGYTGMVDGLRKTYRQGGVRGLFRGVDGAIPRVMVGSATQLATFDYSRRIATEGLGIANGHAQAFTASVISAIATVTMMNPFDVVSTRLYQSAGIATKYRGPLDCALQTLRNEGPRVFMRGWTAQMIRLMPHTALTFQVLEHLRPVFLGVDAFVHSPAGEVAAEAAGTS